MWNLSESDKRYYERKEQEEKKQKRALSKAENRGIASIEWHKTNVLNASTLADFQKAMKKADKEWGLKQKEAL